jgi:hypothetical protein
VINSPAPTIVINSNPNTNSICFGTSITLTASGGLTYLWNGGIVDGQSFTPNQTATYSVTGTDVNGCSNTATKTIVVNALPVITASVIPNSGTVCLGDNITLSGNGGVSYVWTGGVTNAVAFAVTQSGTYTVTGTDINGCSATASKTVIVNALPNIGAISNPFSLVAGLYPKSIKSCNRLGMLPETQRLIKPAFFGKSDKAPCLFRCERGFLINSLPSGNLTISISRLVALISLSL